MSGPQMRLAGNHYLPPSHESDGREVYRKTCDEAERGSKALLDALNLAIGDFASTHGLSFEWAKVYCANGVVPNG
jgi:hypothetical protein